MPNQEIIEALIAMVEAGRHDAAIEQFYTEDATMQENLTEPSRAGRDHLVAHERTVLAAHQAVRSWCIRPVLIEGDTVVIHWVFEFDSHDGKTRRLDEIAHQTWCGDKVLRERFYYDPTQLTQLKVTS